MFDKTLFGSKSDRVIINFQQGVDLGEAQQTILDSTDAVKNPVTFDFISAMSCEIAEEDLASIAKLDIVKSIYLDEEIKLDIESPGPLEFDEIFQLNQCATQINSRTVPYTGLGINISIIDTGIDFTHLDLNGKKLAETSFVITDYGFDADEEEGPMDYNGHGTHCAGIATGTGSQAPSGYNLTGIAPQAKLVNAKALSRFGGGFSSSVIAAIEWSVTQNVNIISMSLGFSSPDPDHPVSQAVDAAVDAGIVVVVAAGNSGPLYSTVGVPAAARSVITVGANDKNGYITNFSSRGPNQLEFVDPDVVAPGHNVLSPIAHSSLLGKITELEDDYVPGLGGSDYAILSGTSMAAPMVAGAAALLLDAFPNLNPYMVRIALMEGAESLGYSTNTEGAGRINVKNSYDTLVNSAPTFNLTTVIPSSLPTPPFQYALFSGDRYQDNLKRQTPNSPISR
jgi:serine protease AprX